jgi:hypothetical protein
MVTAGDLDALRGKLGEHKAVALMLGERLSGPAWQKRANDLIRTLSPDAKVLVRGRAPLTALMEERGELPIRRRPVPDGSRDVLGRPNYVWEDVKLNTTWLAKQKKPMTGADALLVIDDAELDLQAWRSLRAHAVGGCEEPLQKLAAAQETSLAVLEPFLDHADAVLWQVYHAALQAHLPTLGEELAPYAKLKTRDQFEEGSAWEQYQCGHAYWEYLQNFVRCGDEAGTCPSAPRMFLIGGARIGSAEPSFYVHEKCPAAVGRDYAVHVRQLAREAAQVAGEHLNRKWVSLADRLGTITDVHAALEDICTPRRRRFAEADLAEARARLVRVGEALASDEGPRDSGRWLIEDDTFHVPGLGPVRQLARYDAGPGSANETVVREARAMRTFLQSRALCRSGFAELPLAAMLTNVGTSEVEFLGYFYEEELFCADLPPLLTPSEGG